MEVNGSKAHITEIETKNQQYEQLLADVWVGIVLTLLLLSCVCCMCSCLLYHKFQQWKRSLSRNNDEANDVGSRNALNIDCESLPSYTIASGLPTYEEALQQLNKKSAKYENHSKRSSNVSLHVETMQSVSKGPLLDYLQKFVQEKT